MASGGKDDNEVNQNSSIAPDVLREHELLTDILSLIPHKVQRGLSTQYESLELTCLDANEYFIALGSSVGIVFLYDREKQAMQKLKSENSSDAVSCVCLHHGLDDMVGIGYTSGTIYIFQLPNIQIGHSKKLERFIVCDINTHPITCLTWSTNGMKLSSGDTKGYVGCTEVDFYEGQCTSSVLLIEEKGEIIQLYHGHRSLLVSTTHRCLVCRMDDKNKIVQIGSKDRKITGEFGGCFIPAMCKVEAAQLYSSRPGFRVWKASITGTVSNTYMFKELIATQHPTIDVLDFEVTNITKARFVNQFGQLLLFRDKELVTWNESCLYVINPELLKVVGSQHHMGFIKCVAVSESEIFILRQGTNRNLIRIADKPITKPAGHLLTQLQAQREEKQLEKVEPESTKTDHSKDTKPHTEKSPFKLFQGNILDKMKNIPKPAVIIQEIQEKLNIDNRNQPFSKGHVIADSDVGAGQKPRDVSPPGPLPPVVILDSPDLLSIQLSVTPNISIDSTLNITPNPGNSHIDSSIGEGRAPLPARQTGTGAFSALARLQDDHHEEENSESVYRFAKTEEADIAVIRTSLFDAKPEEDVGGIVFSRKTKVKHKKKKRVSKEKHLALEKDQDSISVNSTNSVNSETSSGTSASVKQLEQSIEQSMEHSIERSVKQLEQSIEQSMEHSIEQSIELSADLATKQSNVDNKQVDEHSIDDDKLSNKPLVKQQTEEDTTQNTLDETEHSGDANTQNDFVAQSANTVTKEDSFKTVAGTDVVENKEDDISHKGRESITETNEDQKKKETEAEALTNLPAGTGVHTEQVEHSVTVKNNEAKSVETIQKVEGETASTDGDLVTRNQSTNLDDLYPSGTSGISNLDIEMARLDSYLSESPDVEKPASFYLDSKADVENILLKDTRHRLHGLTEDRATKYVQSSLEKELAELEKSSMVQDPTPSLPPKVPLSPNRHLETDHSSPSIYTIYNKPGYEDFYSKYAPKSPSELSSMTSDSMASLSDKKDDLDDENDDSASLIPSSSLPTFMKTLNTWTELSLQGNIYSLCVSTAHVWVTDRSTNIFYSLLNGPGLSWKRASGNASQISVSKEGNIVWALNKGTVSAGTKITPKRPEGMKWVEAVKDVAYMCVDETCAWYIKTNHEVMIQKGLSRDRPCYTGIVVECKHRLKQIMCRDGVVWALTEKCHWLYRSGITRDCPEGTAWKSGDSGSDNRLFSHMSLGEDKLGWAMDILGQVWFCAGVTRETPRGDNHWWQVPLSGEYFMKDMTALDLLKSFSTKFDPQKLTLLLSTQSGGLVAGQNGVWVCPEYKNLLQVCRGSIEGQLWRDAYPESLAVTSCWKILDAKVSSYENGFVWSMQPNGDIFAFTSDRQQCVCIEAPQKIDTQNVMFVCMSVCFDALWGLTGSGEVYIRTGMSSLEPRGSGWAQLDLSQLGESQLVSLSCANESVWSVDSDGNVFHRIGVKAPSDLSLNAAWLPVDNSGTDFTQIVSCEQDWKVWAIDNRRQVYVRHGVSNEMPIGRSWIHVSGTPAMHITLSNNFVWALNHSGELLCRHGVTPDNPAGDYWKKIPGSLTHISATPNDIIWGINKDGQLVRRFTKYIVRTFADTADRSGPRNAPRGTSISSEDGEWEFV